MNKSLVTKVTNLMKHFEYMLASMTIEGISSVKYKRNKLKYNVLWLCLRLNLTTRQGLTKDERYALFLYREQLLELQYMLKKNLRTFTKYGEVGKARAERIEYLLKEINSKAESMVALLRKNALLFDVVLVFYTIDDINILADELKYT